MTAKPAPALGACRHCGATIEADARFCCPACEVAAAIISGAGLDQYYAEREECAPRPGATPSGLEHLPVVHRDDGLAEARFTLGGLRCTSCVWVAEKVLERTAGVESATVSYGTGRAKIVFDPNRIGVGAIAGRVAALGYVPRAVDDRAGPASDEDLLIRLGVSAFCAANVMSMAATLYAGWFDGIESRFADLFRWASLAVATPAALYSAIPFFAGAARGLRHRLLHMDAPVSLGIAVLYVHGVVATVVGEDSYLDSMTMLITLLLLGRVLESRGRRRAHEAAESLAASLPRMARRVTATGLEVVTVDALAVGDLIDLGSGEEIGADGVVQSGTAQVRMALLTGESEPTTVGAGDAVVAGAVVADGTFRMRVTAIGGATMLERMANELREAADRPTVAGLPDRIAPYFTAATLVIAVATFTGWFAYGGAEAAIPPTVAVLVVACPCAVALAQPLAVASGLGAAARRGLLLRSGDALLRLASVDVVAFDKTGTVTGGVPVVVDADPLALRVAAGLERYSVHPVARAIVDEAIRRNIPLPSGIGVIERPGEGISGAVDGRRVEVRPVGPGTLEVLDDRRRIGTIALRDTVRPDARRTAVALGRAGLELALLTGDHEGVASRIGHELGIAEIAAGVTPIEKRQWIAAKHSAGHRVLFAGDGLNDGPALAEAAVGVAMGTGAASSVLVADGVIARPGVAPLLGGIRAGRAARAVIRANLRRSLAYNGLAVAAAAAGLVNPLVAAVLMPLSSGLVMYGAMTIERAVAREERWTR